MGSGKTTLGKKTAPLLGLNFIDLDAFIEQQQGCTITSIFEEKGEQQFRKIEAACLRKLIDTQKPSIISLGGGTVCFEDNLALVKENGWLIYISLPATALADRLSQTEQTRPLFKDVSKQELPKKIKELLEQRLVYYEQAQLTVKGLNLTPKHLHEQIVELLQK